MVGLLSKSIRYNKTLMMVKRIVLCLIVCFPGWAKASPPEKKNPELVSYFTSKAVPLNTSADLNAIIEESGSRQLVLLGEATHGTREFYHWRAEITKRLIVEKKFNFIAVEGDWATICRLNKYVKGLENSMSSAKEKAHFRAVQNALVIQNAENFYRLVLQNSIDSWNARVDHMWVTVNQIKSSLRDAK